MLKIHVFWDVTLSTGTVTSVSKEYNTSVFRGLMNHLTLKISATIYQLIQHNMPENVCLHQYCCKNLNSHARKVTHVITTTFSNILSLYLNFLSVHY
jgi:hypothetical protein